MAKGGRNPEVVGRRNLDVTEVMLVGNAPDSEVVYVIHRQVLRKLQLNIFSLIGS